MHEFPTRLFVAIERGDSNVLKTLLPLVSDPNQRNVKHQTLLMVACQAGNLDAVASLLLQPNIDVQLKEGKPNELSALMYAVMADENGNRRSIVDALFASNKLSFEDYHIAMIYYASLGDVEKVKECITKYHCYSNYYHRLFHSVLHKAAAKGQSNVINAYINDPHVNINLLNYLNESPFHVALRNNHIDAAELFLLRSDFNLYQQSLLQGTPLTAAAFNHQTQLALKLLKRENHFNDKQHPRAFLCAIENDDEELITAMIAHGADINLVEKDSYSEPNAWVWEEQLSSPFVTVTDDPIFDLPILLALQQNKLLALQLLLRNGVDLNKSGDRGLTANQLLATNYVSVEAKRIVTEFERSKVNIRYFTGSMKL
jgi:ankyrin repeat protein